MIYKYKTERISSKDCSNLIDLSINLRDGNINQKEVLKDQINFKSNLGQIRKGNPKSKSENQIGLI